MNQISKSAVVRAPVARVWQTLADVGTIADWHPGVRSSPVLSSAPTGMGATRRVELYDGSSAVEEVTAMEPGRSLTVTMSEHTMPLSHGAATFAVEADGPDRTRVTMRLDYAMKFGPLGWLLNLLLLRRVLGNLFESVLAGLDHHLRTGEPIGQGWVAPS